MNSFSLMAIESSCYFFHNRSFPSLLSPRFNGLLQVCAKRRKKEVLIIDAKKLEDELFEFMGKSTKADSFPTKCELIDAGRSDLVDAILKHGGWFALGWNLDQEEEDIEVSSSSCASSEIIKEENKGKMGIEGILSGLEKERNFAYGVESTEKKLIGKKSSNNEETKRGYNRSTDGMPGKSIPRCLQEETFYYQSRGSEADIMPTKKIWSLQRESNRSTKYEAAECTKENDESINCKVTKALQVQEIVDNNLNDYVSYVDRFVNSNFVKDISKEQKHVDCELNSMLQLGTSKSGDTVSYKDNKNIDISTEEMHSLSDELEYKQTEIRIARDKLRSTRAKLAVLRGKMIMEEQKIMDIRMKGVNIGQKTSSQLRTVRINWPSSASEVMLAGSFDGWNNQRRMERSKEGMFTMHLRLYPGRYQIKFIVDGVWMVDPLRPVVNDSGYENNLIIVD